MLFESKKLIWWGRSDVTYSRNGVIRGALHELGVGIQDFYPRFSFSASIEAVLSSMGGVDAIWVPCFRQRDVLSASKWAKKKKVSLIFDPLISSYDKQVFERKKFLETSQAAKRLLSWESGLFHKADIVVADTYLHAEYFEKLLGVANSKIFVVPVSAEKMFHWKEPAENRIDSATCKVLFYGNYLELHGVNVIADAIVQNQNQSIKWTLVGDGALRAEIEKKCKGIPSVQFIDWIEYAELPNAIHNADVILGIFDTGDKANRVIPNKVYQALACGRPVVTMQSKAYPQGVRGSLNSGIFWSEAGSPKSLLSAIESSAAENQKQNCLAARETYDNYFSMSVVRESLSTILNKAFAANP